MSTRSTNKLATLHSRINEVTKGQCIRASGIIRFLLILKIAFYEVYVCHKPLNTAGYNTCNSYIVLCVLR